MKSEKVNYAEVEAVLKESGITFSSPTAGHYRIFVRNNVSLVYYPKSDKVALQVIGEKERLLDLPSNTVGNYNEPVQRILILMDRIQKGVMDLEA